MKLFLSFTILFLSLGLLMAALHHSEDQFHYSQLNLPEAEFQEIKASRSETDRELLDELTFNHYPSFADKPSSRRFYSVDPDDPDTDPAVGFSSPEKNTRLAFSGEIGPGSNIPFIAYTDSEYKEYSIAITTLPLVQIECETTAFWRVPVPIKLTLFQNHKNSRQPLIKSDGTIHVRGNTTNLLPKKPFRISLTTNNIAGSINDNQQALLDLRKDGDWLLYPAYNDQEKIRNVFSSNLWFNSCSDNNSFNLKNGMEYRFIELFLNQEYWGLYALGYPIDAKQMRIDPDNQGHYEEFIFKQITWGPDDPNYPEPDSFLALQFEADPEDLGYGLSIMDQYFQYLKSGAPDGLSHNDENNAVDLWLFTLLIQHIDSVYQPGKINNIIYTIKSTDEGKKILYTPWDMDATWGNGLGMNHSVHFSPDDNSYEMALNPVSMMLRNGSAPEIITKIRDRYAELRADGWSEQAIDRMLDGFEQNIFGSGAYQRDMERWPDGSYQDPELRLTRFRDYVHKRLASMDSYVDSLSQQFTSDQGGI